MKRRSNKDKDSTVHTIEYRSNRNQTVKVRKKARIRNQYNQAPHLTQDTTQESDKTQYNTTYKRAKRLVLSKKVTTRLQ